MFPELLPSLGWGGTRPLPAGEDALLTDYGGADASFLLHHFSGLFVAAGRRAVVVALSQTETHYGARARRRADAVLCLRRGT